MAAPSEDDDALLVSNDEETVGAEVSEDDRLFTKTPEWQTEQYHSSTEGHTDSPQGRFAGLGRWSKVLLKWWRTLVIILTPLILLLLFAFAEDTKVILLVVYSLGV